VSIDVLMQIKYEVLMLLRFSIVGLIATSVHVGLVWVLITRLSIGPFMANSISFLIAFGVSFTGQYIWTFRSARVLSDAIKRFFLVSFSAFGLNNIILALLLTIGFFPDYIAAILAVFIIPIYTYLLGRFWAFRC
jgi:putative flippase GtrA